MKKIIFCSMVMKKELNKCQYKVNGNSKIAYDGEVYFPVNGVLAKTLNEDDDVKVVLIKTIDHEGNADNNERVFKEELNAINEKIGASINYVTIATPFVETKSNHEVLMRSMIAEMEEGAEIIADITFGPKPEAIAIFMALGFADKFYDCDIRNIVYGKVDFKSRKDANSLPINPVLYDLTSLYYLNSIINSLDNIPADKAVSALDALLNI